MNYDNDNANAMKMYLDIRKYVNVIGKAAEAINESEEKRADILRIMIALELVKESLMDIFMLSNPNVNRRMVDNDIDKVVDSLHENNLKIERNAEGKFIIGE